MRLAAMFICFVAVLPSSVSAIEKKTRVEWERHIPGLRLSSVLRDNVGNIAVVGSLSNRAGVVLFTTRGEVVASRAVCAPTATEYSLPLATSDESGNIFLAWGGPKVRCIRFEPRLTALSRLGGYDYDDSLYTLVADNSGGILLGLSYTQTGLGERSFITRLQCFGQRSFFLSDSYGWANNAIIAVNPNGTIHLVSRPGWYRYAPIRITTFTPEGTIVWDKELAGHVETPYAATCDSSGNLIIVGLHRDTFQFATSYPNTLKLNAAGDVLWRNVVTNDVVVYPSPYSTAGPHYSVAVGAKDEIIVTGPSGTFKYSPDGTQLWRDTTPSAALWLSRQGEIALYTFSEQTFRARKLMRTGKLAWEADLSADSGSGELIRDGTLSVDEVGSVYVGLGLWTIRHDRYVPTKVVLVKLHESNGKGTRRDRSMSVSVPELNDCEPFELGPCDESMALQP